MLPGKEYERAVAATVSCAPGAAVQFSHVAGGCVFRLVWIVALRLRAAASDRQFLPVLRPEECSRMVARHASPGIAPLAARCVPVEYAAQFASMKALAALMERAGSVEQPRHEVG